jgi:putative phage-type endonuclease
MYTIDHELRRTRIGASEIAAVAGLSPYAGPLDIYAEKLGLSEPFQGNERTKWGNIMEPVIAHRYSVEHPEVLVSGDGTSTYLHADHEWAAATPDRVVCKAGGAPVLLEIKTAGVRQAKYWGEPWTDRVPEHYLAQVHWQMFVINNRACGARDPLFSEVVSEAHLAVLIGGNDYREYVVPRDEEFEGMLFDAAHSFWHHNVLGQAPPDATAPGELKRYVERAYGEHGQTLVEVEDLADKARDLASVKEELKALYRRKDDLEASFKAAIAEDAGVEGSWGRATWKAPKASSSTDYKTAMSDFRDRVVAWFADDAIQTAFDEAIAKATTQKTNSRRFYFRQTETT